MHIVYIDPHPVPGHCPESMQILQTVDALAQLGAKVTVVTPHVRSGVTPSDILGRPVTSGVFFENLKDLRDYWWNPSRSGSYFYKKAQKYVEAAPSVDMLLVRNLKLAEKILSSQNHPPLVFETHEVFSRTFAENHKDRSWITQRKLAALQQRERGVYEQCDGIACLTQWLADDLRDEFSLSKRMAIVPDGVDIDAAEKARKPMEGECVNKRAQLLYLGSLHPWKGIERLLSAMPEIKDAHLLIAGGPGKRISELRAQAMEYGISDRIEFAGEIPPAKRFEIINSASICMLPLTDTMIGSRYTSPLKLFEYMAMGKPIVAADVPAIRSVITSGVDGLLVPVDDQQSLAEAVNLLLNNPEQGKSIGDAARKTVLNFTWTSRAQTLLNFFQEIITDQ